jgi:hypothetical protein
MTAAASNLCCADSRRSISSTVLLPPIRSFAICARTTSRLIFTSLQCINLCWIQQAVRAAGAPAAAIGSKSSLLYKPYTLGRRRPHEALAGAR